MSKRSLLYKFLFVSLFSLLIQYCFTKWIYNTKNAIQPSNDANICSAHWSDVTKNGSLRAIFEAASDYLGDIERLRKLLRDDRNITEWSCKRSRRVVNVKKAGYFHRAKSLRNVYTLTFQTAKCKLAPYLVRRYYDYSSNNCSALMGRIHPRSGQIYGAQCKENIEETLNASPLQDKDLLVGLPYLTTINQSNTIWSFIHVIRNAVVDDKGNIYTEDGKLEPYQCYRRWQPRCDDDRVKEMPAFGEVFTIKSLWSTYYHTTVDQFVRLALYRDFLVANPQIVLHYSSPHPFQNVLGLGNRPVVNDSIRAEVVYAPGATPCGQSALFQTQLFSAMLRTPTGTTDEHRKTVVLIKRSRKRFFAHHDDILTMLRKHSTGAGLIVEVFSDDPVPIAADTRRMFKNAVIIVAPHGAGETNIVLSAPGTVLIEGLCKDAKKMLSLCYQYMARVLGMHYHAIVPQIQCMDISAADIEKPFLTFLHLYSTGRIRRG